MPTLSQIPDQGDPSDILQLFPKTNLQLLCCRYWWLKHWEFRELAFPYWRIYYNMQEGAFIETGGKTYSLHPQKIYLIAPNTSYSTHLFDHPLPQKGYALTGGRITTKKPSPIRAAADTIEHLFIHFNIGSPYDNVSPGLFSFDLTPHLQEKIHLIVNHLSVDNSQFSFYTFLAIQSLITDLLSDIDENCWELLAKDYRILNALSYIENNTDKDLSNETLADMCQLATNAFTKLFKDEVGVSPQRFVKRKRINTACVMLHHSDDSIDEVAIKSGFANRYHFTRIFSQLTGLAPAKYRKEFRIK